MNIQDSILYIQDRGVYAIESLEQMLQKNFRGGDLTSNQGGMYSKKNICRLAAVIFERDVMDSLAATDIIDTFAQCSSKLQNMLGVHCAPSACGDNN